MSDPENFLTRWSRRKREVADEGDRAQADEQTQETTQAPSTESTENEAPLRAPSAEPVSSEPAFDLSKLPPIESITAETDIRAFLAPGVPAELRLAALRRAWVADPKVRDFVGLNDYDFDFHTPGAIPGFGSLEMTDELRQEVARIFRALQPETERTDAERAAEQTGAKLPGTPPAQPPAATGEINALAQVEERGRPDSSGTALDHPVEDQDELIAPEATTQRNKESIATQQERSPTENLQTLARRGHGRALPK